jgi:hypothetical protein
MHEQMANLHGNLMTLFNSKLRVYGNIYFSVEPVPYPSDPDLAYFLRARSMGYGMSDLVNHLRINTVEEANKYGFSGLPHNAENSYSDNEADNGICKRIPQPNTDCPKEHRKAGQSVYSGMLPVSDQRGAANLLANLDTENSNSFIAEEADYRCGNNCP